MKQKVLPTILAGACTLCITAAIATPAFAADDITISKPHRMSSNMTSNLYIGAQLAYASYKEVDDNSAAFGLFGGFHLNEVLAVEAAYNDFGEAEKGGVKAEASAFSLGLLGKLPLKTDLTLFGRVGLAAWDIDGSVSDSGTDVYFGIGADYDISGTSAVRFGIDTYSLNGDTDEDITAFAIGFIFKP
ncbi:MAG: outer membrane beta-barrel protein [Gammaproteobacteria bacterium]|nr:outer membrane beta-barrel protein [Gammaproteobacteria bacterium]